MSDAEALPEGSASRIEENDIYEESELLLAYSILIYAISDIRTLARKGKLSGDPELIERVQGVGFTGEEAVNCRLCAENKESLEKTFGKETFDIYYSALQELRTKASRTRVPAFDDEMHESGCVYGILVDEERQRIVVTFRGSANAKDWIEDAKVYMKSTPNPVNDTDHTALGIHAGFHEYLFSTRGTKHSGEAPKCKCDKILEEVTQLLEENPGYHVYTTGHSLGAALSTLFAFRAAASNDPRIPKPVTSINFASPRAGDNRFRDTFQFLEKQGQVRCLRFVNHGDVITNMPASQLSHFCLIDTYIFRHVGMEVEVFTERKRFISFIYAAPGSIGRRFIGDLKKFVSEAVFFVTLPLQCAQGKRYMLRHSCLTYLKHLRIFREELKKVTVGDLYKDVYENSDDKKQGKKGEKMHVRKSLAR